MLGSLEGAKKTLGLYMQDIGGTSNLGTLRIELPPVQDPNLHHHQRSHQKRQLYPFPPSQAYYPAKDDFRPPSASLEFPQISPRFRDSWLHMTCMQAHHWGPSYSYSEILGMERLAFRENSCAANTNIVTSCSLSKPTFGFEICYLLCRFFKT